MKLKFTSGKNAANWVAEFLTYQGQQKPIVCQHSVCYKLSAPVRETGVDMNDILCTNPTAIWNALRKVACSTNPPEDATTIVLLKEHHVKDAFKLLRAEIEKTAKGENGNEQ